MLRGFCRFWGRAAGPLPHRPARCAAALAVLAALAGCGGPAKTPARLLAGWDTSGGARARLSAFVELGSLAARRLDSERDRATLYRMDRETAEFYDGKSPESLEELQGLLVRELERKPAGDGTYPARFWRAAAEAAERAREPVVVLLLTDGGNDDRSPEGLRELHAAVEQLAKNTRVRKVCVWGTIPGMRAQLREDLAALGDRLEVRGLEDADPQTVEAAE